MGSLSYPKTSRLLKRAEFRRVYDHGTRFSSRLLSAFLFQNPDPGRPVQARIGFTIPRAVGKAVVRNRIRRRTREALRADYALIAPCWDIVIHPRRSVLEASFDEVRREVRRLVERCNPS